MDYKEKIMKNLKEKMKDFIKYFFKDFSATNRELFGILLTGLPDKNRELLRVFSSGLAFEFLGFFQEFVRNLKSRF